MHARLCDVSRQFHHDSDDADNGASIQVYTNMSIGIEHVVSCSVGWYTHSKSASKWRRTDEGLCLVAILMLNDYMVNLAQRNPAVDTSLTLFALSGKLKLNLPLVNLKVSRHLAWYYRQQDLGKRLGNTDPGGNVNRGFERNIIPDYGHCYSQNISPLFV